MRGDHAPLTLAALLFGVVALLEFGFLHLLRPLNERQVDSFVRRQAHKLVPDRDIVIVDIDEASLGYPPLQKEAGSWPWPRALYAELIEEIEKQKPAAMLFDIAFAESDTFRPESDAAFIDALRAVDNVYLPTLRLAEQDDARGRPLAEAAPLLGLTRTPRADAQARAMLLPPLAVPPELWKRSGVINFRPDVDGVARSYWLRMNLHGWLLPSLPARVAGDLGYAVPDEEALLLAWRGPVGSFRHVSFKDLFEDYRSASPHRPADEFRNAIVIVGTSASALQDLRLSPRSSVDQGVEILATAIDNLKNGRRMHALPQRDSAVLALLLLAALYGAFRRRWSALRIGIALTLLSLLFGAGSYVGAGNLWRVPVLLPLLFAWTYFLVAALLAYRREKEAKQKAVRLFGRFLNSEVVSRLVERGETVESLSGKPCEISVLFSDIRGFTSLSEKRSPQEVVELLNRYFAKQAAVVFRHGGTLDKFIGDCIMAFWGAPLPYPDHAQRAVACALEMERTLQEFRNELGADGGAFDVGIGVHTGTAVVGFIGAEQKLDYTAIGDTVNLASRVEGLTKGVARILVTTATATACGTAYTFTPRGAFPVKGRVQPVDLFEPGAT